MFYRSLGNIEVEMNNKSYYISLYRDHSEFLFVISYYITSYYQSQFLFYLVDIFSSSSHSVSH